MNDPRMIVHVSQKAGDGTWTVLVLMNDTGRLRQWESEPLWHFSEVPSALCQLVHEATGSSIPSLDGVFG